MSLFFYVPIFRKKASIMAAVFKYFYSLALTFSTVDGYGSMQNK